MLSTECLAVFSLALLTTPALAQKQSVVVYTAIENERIAVAEALRQVR